MGQLKKHKPKDNEIHFSFLSHLLSCINFITSAGGGFFLTGLRTGASDFSEASGGAAAGGGFLAALAPVVAAFLGLLALGGATLISTFSLNSSIYAK